MTARYNKISNEAIRDATGKSWEEWFALLDREGAMELSHKEIAARLVEDGHIQEGDEWWAQTVTVGYEYARGRRVKGQTADAGFQVGVQRTLPIDAARLWTFITGPEGLSVWLGEGTEELALSKGAAFETTDGTTGEIRSVYPGEKLRLTWRPDTWAQETTLQLYLDDKGGKAALLFHHEKLESPEQRSRMKEHWRGVLERIETAI
jgi:uncharacterized protein YndB with AHSA1/START domain